VNLFSYFIQRLSLDGLAGIKFITEKKFKHCYQILRAHLHFYQAIPRLRKEREELVKQDTNPNLTGMYDGSIVQDFFKKGKKYFSELGI
jgi:hypothetical protein